MKIVKVYDKDEFYKITYYKKKIFEIMDNFFKNNSGFSSLNYYRNLETLELCKVDELDDVSSNASYDYDDNMIFFNKNVDILHELFHVASYNSETKKDAFLRSRDGLGYYLVEGMTEYLSMISTPNCSNFAYPYEVFCVSVLEDIPDIFKYYFCNGYDDFIKIFPDKKEILSLMYSLDYFGNEMYRFENDINYEFDNVKFVNSIKNSLNSSINLGLSFCKDDRERNEFYEKNMDLIMYYGLNEYMKEYYSNFDKYSYKLIKSKIKK